MFINGLTFIVYDKNFTVLLIVSTLGIVGDGSDVGPFKSIRILYGTLDEKKAIDDLFTL